MFAEHHDLRESQPALFSEMTTALAEHAKTVYQTRYAEPDTEECMTKAQARIYYQGFLGARKPRVVATSCKSLVQSIYSSFPFVERSQG